MTEELKKIKKYYGENMMHLCREYFPTILEQEGILLKLLEMNFEHSKLLYEDIIDKELEEEFKNYIYSLVDVEKEEIEIIEKTPEELLKEVGYKLYKCQTEEEIQFFKKYYKKGEELCTFNGGRLNRCHVFFAVKEDVEKIKREDYENPEREDKYGTSVISIQFSRGNINTLSIKNRYNHTVNNPDATYKNNLENITPGLTKSFEREYNLNINQSDDKFEIPGYVKANDGKYYKYNYEINNIYYCQNNIIIDNFEVVKEYQEKEKYIVLDYFILNLQNKKIKLYDTYISDNFIDSIKDINKIEVIKGIENKIIKIETKEENKIEIEIDKTNRIISYSNEKVKIIGKDFLSRNKTLTSINLPKVKEIGRNFLYFNKNLTSINLPEVKKIEDYFLLHNETLTNINLPKVEKIGFDFLNNNEILTSINLLELKEIESNFLYHNKTLISINLPEVKEIESNFLCYNENLTSINLPKVEKIGSCFLQCNNTLTSIDLPKVKEIGHCFLDNNEILTSINLPVVERIGDYFLCCNKTLIGINLPEVRKIEGYFLNYNKTLKSINLPKVKEIRHHFLYHNEKLTSINLPEVKEIGYAFLYYNESLTSINLPNVEKIEYDFLHYNRHILIDNNEINKIKVKI